MECPTDSPHTCNLASHTCRCTFKACPNDATKCATDNTNGGCCPSGTVPCGNKCISTDPGNCCVDKDCNPGNKTCNQTTNKCECPQGKPNICADGTCQECCDGTQCKDPTPTCNDAHRCVVCSTVVCMGICCPRGNTCFGVVGACPPAVDPGGPRPF
jgi:hypothetical protein